MSDNFDPGRLPEEVYVWACPRCGYWREDKTTGVHVFLGADASAGEIHELVRVEYVRPDVLTEAT